MVQTRLSIRKCPRVYKFESLPYDVPLRPRKAPTRKIRKLPVPFVKKITEKIPEKEIEIMEKVIDLTKEEMELENKEMSDRPMETASDEELPLLEIIMLPKPKIPESEFKLPKLEKVQSFDISNCSLNSTVDFGRPKKRRIDRTLLKTGGKRRTSYNLGSPSDASDESDDDSSDIDDSSSDSDEDDYEMEQNDLYI